MKKKLTLSLLLLAFLLPLLSGCLEKVELNRLGIVSGLGVDYVDGNYEVTVQILNPAIIAGKNTNALPVYSLTAEGRSIHEAYNKLNQMVTSAPFLSHLSVVVIDEALAREGFSPLLNFALRHSEIRPDITIVVAKDQTAKEVLNVLTPLDTIPASNLDVSNKVPSHTARLVTHNLYEVVEMVNMKNINAVLNAVSMHHEDPKDVDHGPHQSSADLSHGSTVDNVLEINAPTQLRIKDLAVFHGDKLVGFLDDNEAQIYNMIEGNIKRYALFSEMDDDFYTSAGIVGVDTKIKTNLKENEATITIKATGLILENTYPLDLTNDENLKMMGEKLTKQLESDVQAFVQKVQKDLKSDILGIGLKAAYQDHKHWETVTGYWDELFPEVEIKLEIEMELSAPGEIGNVTI